MSDILLHNAVVENQKLIQKFVAYSVDPISAPGLSYYSNNSIGCKYNFYTNTISQCPTMVKSWKKYLSPLTCPKNNGFKVCDSSSYYRCGASCTWTVPAGVTKVQFQLWGHGGGNSGQCCCGGAPFGPTGSYSTVCVTVTPSEVFTLTSGCAYCCYATQAVPGYSNQVTSVVSTTTANFAICAMGAIPEYNNWMSVIPGTSTSQCGIPSNDGCNPTSCSGWNFCWDSAADNVSVPHTFSKTETWTLGCNGTGRNAVAYGLPAIYPAMVIGADLWTGGSCTISAPVFGFENCTCTWAISNGATAGSVGGCYYTAQAGYQQIPAVGGYAQWACGGQASIGGDAGGMGMICVSWN